jgi:2-polyprenyl-6-methoxyphenol hydroxylase-like FAD-dependent oxidoreductase
VQAIRQNDHGVTLEYNRPNSSANTLQTRWLIGADGKRGVVRKSFLEKVADIRQVSSDYRYEGTWVAANLKIQLCTLETHPDFPAWKLGLSPQEVHDLFWPKGWHFCSPPGKPTATGRFGPHHQRFWRHEFRQDDWDSETMDAEELLWEHLGPMLTRSKCGRGRVFGEPATYPRDCIEVLRCRPFTFAHKIINRWYYRDTILIGDAAHVFPPFGGQGIASGIRDAHQLAWRIALMENASKSTETSAEAILEAWATERTQSVKDAAFLTKMNGTLCNNAPPLLFTIVTTLEWALRSVFPSYKGYDPQATGEQNGMRGLPGGYFLSQHGGGLRFPQVYVDTLLKGTELSDSFFLSAASPMQIVVLVRNNDTPTSAQRTIAALLKKHQIPDGVISPDATSILSLTPCRPESIGSCAEQSVRKASVTPLKRLSKREARPGYDIGVFDSRLGKDVRYVVLRPDFYVFAMARGDDELGICLQGLRELIF